MKNLKDIIISDPGDEIDPIIESQPQQIKDLFLQNFKTKYALGVEFSNEEYLSYQELPFASFINFKLIDPATPEVEVNAPVSFNFDERLELGNINVVELV